VKKGIDHISYDETQYLSVELAYSVLHSSNAILLHWWNVFFGVHEKVWAMAVFKA